MHTPSLVVEAASSHVRRQAAKIQENPMVSLLGEISGSLGI
jgi:hypothetical protein